MSIPEAISGSYGFHYSHSFVSVSYEHVLGDVFDNWRSQAITDYMLRYNIRSARIDGLPVGPTPPTVPNTADGSIWFVDLKTRFETLPTDILPDVKAPIIFGTFYETVFYHGGPDPHWTGVDTTVSIEYDAENVVGPRALWKRDDAKAGDVRNKVINAMIIARRVLGQEAKKLVSVPSSGSDLGPGKDMPQVMDPNGSGAKLSASRIYY